MKSLLEDILQIWSNAILISIGVEFKTFNNYIGQTTFTRRMDTDTD